MYSAAKLALKAALRESKTKDDLYSHIYADLAESLCGLTRKDLESFYADLASDTETLACLEELGSSPEDLKAYVRANIVKGMFD